MRQTIIAGNWKMNCTAPEAEHLVQSCWRTWSSDQAAQCGDLPAVYRAGNGRRVCWQGQRRSAGRAGCLLERQGRVYRPDFRRTC